jgi:hypothetical protein
MHILHMCTSAQPCKKGMDACKCSAQAFHVTARAAGGNKHARRSFGTRATYSCNLSTKLSVSTHLAAIVAASFYLLMRHCIIVWADSVASLLT